jgi:carbamoyl-phosphate synthase small subunit
MRATLILADGREFGGLGFGEFVFDSAMTGYQEVLTDPSYRRQVVTLTTPPPIGRLPTFYNVQNYGVKRR